MFARIVKLAVAVGSVALFAGLAGPAQAISIGVLTPSAATSFYYIGNSDITLNGFDVFDFTLASDAALTLANGLELSAGTSNDLTFTSVVLKNVTLNSVVAPLAGGIVNQPAGGLASPEDQFSFAWGLLDSSYMYQLTVGRNVTGRAAWNGTIGVTAVPLPAALPLFASGLAGMGLLGRRRKKRDAATTHVA